MAALLVGMSVMAVIMSMAMPVWSTAAKRAREDELVFRGEQYARAIGLFQRKYANALPPSIDVLVNERFLRKKYVDPVTGGEFQALTGAAAQATPGLGAGAAAGRGAPGTGTGTAATTQGAGARGSAAPTGRGTPGTTGTFGAGIAAGQPAFGAGGGIVGVASKSTEKSLRLYNGRGAYNEWAFVPVQRTLQAGGGGGQQSPGLGGRGGENGRGGGQPGTGTQGNRPGAGSGGVRPATGSGDGRGLRPSGQQGR